MGSYTAKLGLMKFLNNGNIYKIILYKYRIMLFYVAYFAVRSVGKKEGEDGTGQT